MGKKTNMLVALTACIILTSGFVSAEVESLSVSPTNSSETDETIDIIERGNELVDQALIPVYDMVKVFLEDIVQPNDLTYMQEKGVDFSDPDDILDSFENNYEEWIWYFIGEYHSLYEVFSTGNNSSLNFLNIKSNEM